MTAKRPTITDVARHAGVSKATVSAVLNDGAGVKAATRERVRTAIELLNYRPTQLARRAAGRKHRSIALVIKEHDNPFYAEVVTGMRAAAEARDYTLLVVSSEGDYRLERNVVALLRGKDVDGLVVTPVMHDDADLAHYFELKRHNFPFVLLEEVRGVPASVVDIDNVAAAREATEYLMALGHERIVHLAGPAYSSHSEERIDGVRRAYSGSRLVFTADAIVAAGAHMEDGYRAGLALFRERTGAQRPTAVTCYNDLVAVGLYRALAEVGLSVPGDVSVIGFDDIPLCQYLPVPLTTVRMPTHVMGERAAAMLVQHIESRQALAPQRVYLDATLVVRQSTAAPAAAAARPAPFTTSAPDGMPRTRSSLRASTLLAALVAGLAATGCGGTPASDPVPAPAPVAAPAPAPAAVVPAWRPAAARLMTRWAADVSPDRVLPEYPRPQMTRARWTNLNGLWEFAVLDSSVVPGHEGDPHLLAHPSRPGGEGPAGALPAPAAGVFGQQRILVPFAPEAALSGVGRHADHVAYRRTFERPAGMAAGERLLLHFGACDWHCTVYVNGRMAADHRGGYDAFTVDATDALAPAPSGAQELVVVAYDPTDKFGQPRGKQVSKAEGIWYTPVTGLWQTVWMEPVPAASIERLRLTPDVAAGALRMVVTGRGTTADQRVTAIAMSEGREVGRVQGTVGRELRLAVPNARLWGPDDPFLYDLRVTLDGEGGSTALDQVDAYFGMRTVGLMKDANGFQRIALNGKPVFQLGPLDQGWWPDGLYTAPTDEALRFDVEMTKALGFNMTRKHIKVEPARWYYHADRLGLPVWQDMPSGWNDNAASQAHFEREMRAMLEDLHSVPSIVAWVPFNEKWGQFDTRRIVSIVQQLDTSRIVNDASGWQHEGAGDIIDVHRYQGPQAMRGTATRVSVVGEFGGLGMKEAGHAWAGDAWGYGGLFPDRNALGDRYDLLLKRLYHDRDSHGIGAGVYTQMTDVEVELNGFFTYDRAILKFDTARTAAVNRGHAPYVLPELTEFTDRIDVRIHQGTPTEVRYTVDGSAVTASSPVYRGPIAVTRTTTVRARAFVDGRPSAAPEVRMDYVKGAGRAPATIARAVTAQGLDYEYYRETTPEPAFRMHWPVRFQVERPEVRPGDLPARKRGTVPIPSLVARDTTELFSFRFTGYVRVPRTGVYTFLARADDGAAMWIGEGPQARNLFWSIGQSPTTTETWGQAALQAGLHPITLTYFQAYGPMALELLVEGPGLPRQRVPASWFVRDRAPRAAAAAASP